MQIVLIIRFIVINYKYQSISVCLSKNSHNKHIYLNSNVILNKCNLITIDRLLYKITFEYSRFTNQGIIRWDGGKIIEKANASSNVDDSSLNKHNLMINKYLYKNVLSRHSVPQRLNSILFIRSNGLGCFRHYSTETTCREVKPNKPEKHLIWNWYNWAKIMENVKNKQIKLAETAIKFNIYDKKVVKLQEAYALSLEFRLLAVRNVTLNKGSRTPGIDGIILDDDDKKSAMVSELKQLLIANKSKPYKSGSVRRVYIPKKNGKLRPLGIPTLKDRCLQELLRLVLDPVVEPFSDRHSYGFRKYRSAKNAIGAIRVALTSDMYKTNKYILDADIKGFFDHINHSWLQKNIPLGTYHKRILKSWLKASVISKIDGISNPEEGTPQGGIISPLLGNFTLNGLEKIILDSIKPIVRNSKQSLKIKRKDGTKSSVRMGVKCVRYADDFVVLARSKRILIKYIKPAIVNFLKERGLQLSEEKTKIVGIRNEPLDFLGYRLKYQHRWSKRYSFFKDKIGKAGIALYPRKDKLDEIVKKIKNIINKSYNEKAYSLITRLNPIIRGWCNYFNLGESTYYRNKLRYFLYLLCWRWAKKKHPRWGKKRIAKFYFLGDKSFKGRKWNFRGFSNKSSRYNESAEGKYTYLIDPTVVVNTVSGLKVQIPEKLLNTHAYSPKYLELVELQTKINLRSLGKRESYKGKLFIKQKGICVICKKALYIDSFLKDGNLHIDHIKPISEGGDKSKISNMRLIHIWCHKDVHGKGQYNT